MRNEDFIEYLELSRDYLTSLSALHQALLKCDIQKINNITDDLTAIEYGIVLMMSDLESIGAYNAEKSEISREALIRYMPRLITSIDQFLNYLKEAKGVSQSLGVLREEIDAFYSEVGALPQNTYGTKQKKL